ncbi:MAG: phosphatidylglycerol lysyltransferase, partial [Treponema sp.]|nr:phosphatidylglycerol lysyltransferase [Treponema sp.]
MVSSDELRNSLSAMILSHSGWRGVFAASGGEEDKTAEIGDSHKTIAAGAALAFAEYLREKAGAGSSPLVLVGCDTRPTGKTIAAAIIAALAACDCRVRYAGILAAPEIMAWARNIGAGDIGFIYISASHNPVGHNGLKFGLTDGGVLSAKEASKLTANFKSLMDDPSAAARLEQLAASADPAVLGAILAGEQAAKQEAKTAYFNFSREVAFG